MRKMVLLTMVVLAALAAFTVSAAKAPSVQRPHRAMLYHASPTRLVASKRNGPIVIATKNGNSWRVGCSNNCSGGEQVVQTASGRYMDFIQQGTNSDGWAYGLWKFEATGNYMASTDVCDGVTVKTNSGSTGTVWTTYFPGNDLYLVSRYCSQPGAYGQRLSADDTINHQWEVNPSGPGNYTSLQFSFP